MPAMTRSSRGEHRLSYSRIFQTVPIFDPERPLVELISILELERIEVNLFRGFTPPSRSVRVFGGQVIAQALNAAYQTVDDRVCHSLHAYFIRPGDPSVPILYEVDQARDGRSFTTRRVVAIQNGEQIFNLAASFQIQEDGFDHQFDVPETEIPENLRTEFDQRMDIIDQVHENAAENFKVKRPIEVRPVNPQNLLDPQPGPPQSAIWMKTIDKVEKGHVLNHCLLAYASDMALLDTSTRPHGVNWPSGRVQMASLDHAMWFHRPFTMDEWLLYAMDSPSASGARGFNRGTIYSRSGALVASVAQEGLIRPTRRKNV